MKGLTKEGYSFEKLESSLPENFPKSDDIEHIYTAKWKNSIQINIIEGDERLTIRTPIEVAFKTGMTWADIKEKIKENVSLKTEWQDGDYESLRLEIRITSIDLSQCTKLARIYFEKCKKLKSPDIENCKALKSIAMNNFDRCTEAEVKLSTSIIWIEEYAFGGGDFSWCKKVLVSNDAIKQLVIDSNYHDESRIEMY